MKILQFFWEFESVGHFSSALEYAKRTNIPRGKFPSNMESLHSLERGHTEVHEVSFGEGHLSALGVGVALLTGLGRLETIMNQLNLLLHLTESIGSKDFSISNFRPVEWRTARTSIQHLERGHSDTFLIAIIVGELGKWQTIFPLASKGKDTSTKHVFKDLINTLRLSIRSRVKSCAEC